MRNRAIHFRPEIDTNDRVLALEAIHLLQNIVQMQFGSIGIKPWFIPNTPGEAYIKRDRQNEPFVRKVYLPNCVHVGPKHRLEMRHGKWLVHDDFAYEDIEIRDERFTELRVKSGAD
ncbi:MAG: hypothetical protein GX795_12375 [Firmicutes bacterium]|nr:hypothetical protein [Bacillota bacterium]